MRVQPGSPCFYLHFETLCGAHFVQVPSVLFFVSINDDVFHLDGPRLSFMFYCLSQS